MLGITSLEGVMISLSEFWESCIIETGANSEFSMFLTYLGLPFFVQYLMFLGLVLQIGLCMVEIV